MRNFKIFICCFLSVIAFSQNPNKSIVILKTWKIDNYKEVSKQTQFKFTENGKSKLYHLEINKSEILLVNTSSKKVVKKYSLRIPDNPTKSCTEQEKEQWDNFNKNVLPSLLAEANKTCMPIATCVQLYCSGSPTSINMILVPPNAKKCKWSKPRKVSEIAKYDFKR